MSGDHTAEGGEPVARTRWPDEGVIAGVLYYCLCGAILLVLDAVWALRTGSFRMVTPLSLPVARALYATGFVASVACLFGRPSRWWLTLGQLVITCVFGWATYSLWLK